MQCVHAMRPNSVKSGEYSKIDVECLVQKSISIRSHFLYLSFDSSAWQCMH